MVTLPMRRRIIVGTPVRKREVDSIGSDRRWSTY